jgi:hypothetical protein
MNGGLLKVSPNQCHPLKQLKAINFISLINKFLNCFINNHIKMKYIFHYFVHLHRHDYLKGVSQHLFCNLLKLQDFCASVIKEKTFFQN